MGKENGKKRSISDAAFFKLFKKKTSKKHSRSKNSTLSRPSVSVHTDNKISGTNGSQRAPVYPEIRSIRSQGSNGGRFSFSSRHRSNGHYTGNDAHNNRKDNDNDDDDDNNDIDYYRDDGTGSEMTEDGIDLAFKPRRSLQNSTAGLKRINTLQGYFNIPVTIDTHQTKNNSQATPGTKSYPISRKTSELFSTSRNASKSGTHIMSQENNSSTGILNTIVNFAQNAVGRGVPKIIVDEPEHQSMNSPRYINNSGSAIAPSLSASTHNHTIDSHGVNRSRSIQKTHTPESKHNSRNEQSPTSEEHNDTVVVSPLNEEHRSSSFLKHLDSILSPKTVNAGQLESAPISPGNNDNVSERSMSTNDTEATRKNRIKSDSTQRKRYSYPDGERETISSELNNKIANEGDVSKVKFQSYIGSAEPAIATFGKGNLTLDALADNSNSVDTNDVSESRVSFKNSSNGHPGMPIFNENYRNSSYIDVSRHLGSNKPNDFVRGRSKTLPTNDATAIIEKGLESSEGKRDSRVTTVSNDEIANGLDTERKSRSLSKKFLNRRSFSPSIGNKVIPSIPFRNSLNRTRNSGEKQDLAKPRSSGVFATTVHSTMDNEMGKTVLQGIEYSNEKKNAEFHNIFKDAGVTPNERLIIDHSCALSRDILLQGRMYISDQHIGFNSNILGFVSTVFIPFKEIVQIEKKTTAGIFPNGIVIDTLHSKYIFASFISRDSTFNLITDVWNQIILGRHYSDDTDNSDYSSNMNDLSDSNSLYNQLRDIDEAQLSDINSTDMTSSDDVEDILSTAPNKKTKGQNKLLFGPVKHIPTDSDFKPTSNEKLVTEFLVEAPMGVVLNILYGEDTKYMVEILEAMKSLEISSIPKLLGSNSRKFDYVKPLPGNIGPSKTKCFITESIDHYDLEKYVKVSQISDTPDVPSGNVFSARSVFIFTWDKNNSTKVAVYGCVDWRGKSWLKSFIEKGTVDGILEMAKTIHSEIKRIINDQQGTLEKVDSKEEVEESNLPKLGPVTHPPTQSSFHKESDDTIIEEEVNFTVPLGTVFQILFGDDTSYIKNMIEKQNNFNISQIPPFSNKAREYTYTKKLANSFGPKQTRCFITEKIEHMDLNNYVVVRQIVKSPDVPSGNNFAVHTRTYLSWGANNSTNMLVVTNVEWSGKSLLKGTIEKGSIEGQKVSTKQVIEDLREIISNAGSIKKKTRRRSRAATTSRKQSESISKPIESSIDNSANNSNTILDNMISIVTETDFTSVKGIAGIIVSILTVILIFRSIFSTKKSTTQLIRPGIIIIDGQEYNYVPNLKTIYDVYENKVGTGDYSVHSQDNNPVMESEFLIWDWLDDRGSSTRHQPLFNKQYEPAFKAVKSHKVQQLKESIKIAEIQLEEMKKLLEYEED
ncbi:Membrane-anchored lipid-binding protein YSP2 [Nakaseomyces bracarensis]|uniref:Membrane-anchored lipid-binding protein YSP2 n=1 Tax=Nakaseomyces bracarensis TaxID=273131 RepID=A0ABR4NVK7_9SACH